VTTTGDEGWFTDPYGRHEARWLSLGQPTKLVRDGDTESYDEVPTGPAVATPVRVEAEGSERGGSDLRRADDAEREGPYDASRARDAAEEAIDGMTGL
jgi:hypothetical protein